MLKTETDIECLSRRCNEFEQRIADLENKMLTNQQDKDEFCRTVVSDIMGMLCRNGMMHGQSGELIRKELYHIVNKKTNLTIETAYD